MDHLPEINDPCSEGPGLVRTDPGWPRLARAGPGPPRTVGTMGVCGDVHCRRTSKLFERACPKLRKHCWNKAISAGARAGRTDGRREDRDYGSSRCHVLPWLVQAGPGWPGLASAGPVAYTDHFPRDAWIIFPEINGPFPDINGPFSRDKWSIFQR